MPGDIFNLVQPKSVKEKFDSEEDKNIESASYLSDILGIDFNRCYNFTMKHKGLTKEQLMVKYLNDQKRI